MARRKVGTVKIVRPVGGLLVSLLLLAASAPAIASSGSLLRVTGLTTEYAHDPLGIDVARPRLSWTLGSPARGQAQAAYRVRVSSDHARVVWDSGKVVSDQSVNVAYGGPALASRTRYHWQVQVWDTKGVASSWSDPAWWETGLLQPSDWKATWIGHAPVDTHPDLQGARWIWYPEGDPAQEVPAGTRYFRAPFDLPAGREVARATLTATADNEFVAYVNGDQVAEGDDWTRAERVDVTGKLAPG